MDAVGADARIGRAFLNAGRGYGGGCFPKDVSGLIMSGLEHGVDLDIMTAAQELNASMPGYIVEKLRDELEGSLTGKKVAVLGLALKPVPVMFGARQAYSLQIFFQRLMPMS